MKKCKSFFIFFEKKLKNYKISFKVWKAERPNPPEEPIFVRERQAEGEREDGD